ncbi:MAG TPA: cupin-like domain-containing protein [Cellvibrionaceae bacterium]
MVQIKKKTEVLTGINSDEIPYDKLMQAQQPVILKGIANNWSLVQSATDSDEKAIAYLKSFYNGKPVTTFVAPPGINGRFFYNEDVTRLNFESRRLLMDDVLDQIALQFDKANSPTFYITSTALDACLPLLRQDNNDLLFNHAMFEDNRPLTSIWIGNRTLVSAHYDAPNNIAVCVAGQRRFTLFPPNQIANLYPGPLDPTPGGQAISMVDFANPDFEKYPGFKQAIASGQVADLEPGDALFYPSMWWHQVEATRPFNILINYWWNTSPKFMSTPMNVLMYALLSLRDRPESEKKAWKEVFDYYVFGASGKAGEHLPEHARGDLAPMDDLKSRKLRAFLINRLNR